MSRLLKFFTSLIILLLFIFVWVGGYYRSNGTYVNGYYRSRPNAYQYDNYSYKAYQPSYNSSYYSGRSYSSNWYTPSYYDSDWSSGMMYNSRYNGSSYSYWGY